MLLEIFPFSADLKRPYQEQAKIDKDVWVAKHGDYKNLPGIPNRKKKAAPQSMSKKPHSSMDLTHVQANPIAAGMTQRIIRVNLGCF